MRQFNAFIVNAVQFTGGQFANCIDIGVMALIELSSGANAATKSADGGAASWTLAGHLK